ncbi:class I SAM-dependent methyltransferase [Luteococcus sp. Sow4_B9]|uniref:class I SAM-dependent methyltransferase n=1 Tax=Luteococcus sp. Sow4_B9 TaxID=3438792 RepID=UPI003F9503E9
MSYDDPRLAVIYDIDNPDGPDHDFFRRMANEHHAADIVDLGCGTGILTVTLTGPGRAVTGIDPAPAMLDQARNRPGGDKVTWVQGTAEQITPGSADLVVMSGNVAMHILHEQWQTTLENIAKGLRPAGILVFESRNPESRAWQNWNDELGERDTPVGRLRESLATDPPDEDGVVVMRCHNEFDDGTLLDVDQRLQFRSHAQIVQDLAAAGLVVDATFSDWSQQPFGGGPGQPLMVFLAKRP